MRPNSVISVFLYVYFQNLFAHLTNKRRLRRHSIFKFYKTYQDICILTLSPNFTVFISNLIYFPISAVGKIPNLF